jgi:hypothetical protein
MKAIELLESLPYLENIGVQTPKFDLIHEPSRAIKAAAAHKWDQVRDLMYYWTTRMASELDRSGATDWNGIYRTWIEEGQILRGKFREISRKSGIPEMLTEALLNDIFVIYMELEYQVHGVRMPHLENLLPIYADGHFPFGWDGNLNSLSEVDTFPSALKGGQFLVC